MRTLLLAVLASTFFWQPMLAWPALVRAEQLIDGAKKEEKLVFYTTMDLPQIIQVVHDFMQKHPFLDVEIHPLETETLVKRVRHEARSGVPTADVLLGGGSLQPLFDDKLLAAYHSPQREGVSEALIDNQGYWSGYYINSYVLGYKTDRVKDEEIPKSYDELLESRWKGNQIAIDSTAHSLLRGLAPIWGGEKAVAYLRQLAGQQPVMARASIPAVESMDAGNVSMVIARAAVLQGYKNKVRTSLGWVAFEPVIAQIDAVMLPAPSPHPNAARLFVDFALSKEGQNALINVQQIAVRPDMEQRTNPRAQGQKWFIERPDRHVNVQESIKLFREIFGIP